MKRAMATFKKIILLVLLLTISIQGFAQVEQDILQDFDETVTEDAKQEVIREAEEQTAAFERSAELDQKLNDYAMASLDHRKAVFDWQLFASKLIFIIVMLIVLSGLVLSYMHFYKSLKAPAGEVENTELEMSTSGIKMNSSVIGLIILVLAIAFLYLYLIHVFPINEFNVDTKAIPEIANTAE